MKNVLIFFGGRSQEHDVSVITGVFTLNALDKTKFTGIPVYVDKDGAFFTGESLRDVRNFRLKKPNDLKRVTLLPGDDALYLVGRKLKRLFTAYAAINCMHGRNGEDGTLSAVLRLSRIAVASPDVFSSAMAMDKDLTKKCLKASDVPTVDGVTIIRGDFVDEPDHTVLRVMKLGFPVIIKPANSGSSIGVRVAKDEKTLRSALVDAFRYDVKVLAEKFLVGAKDVNCACYRLNKRLFVSECERPVGSEFLTFSDKYLGVKNGENREFPANLDGETAARIKEITGKVYDEFGFSGIVRIDYLVKGGEVFLNEINSVPGSLAYYLFCDKISAFTDLLTDLLAESVRKNREVENCKFTFSSSVLDLKGISLKK